MLVSEKLNGYSLSRNFFNWCFENPDKIKPVHIAMYFFALEHCNRLGWKEKFGFPRDIVMENIGIKSYNTFIKTLNDLVDFGFIEMVEKSKNQYSANIIAISNFDKALDKALINHVTTQKESIYQSTDTIIKQVNNKNNKNNKLADIFFIDDFFELKIENVDPVYFVIAKEFHNSLTKLKGDIYSLKSAKLFDWVSVVKKLIEEQNYAIIQLLAISCFINDVANKKKKVESFWLKHIFSLNCLLKEKDGVFYIEKLIQEVKPWLDDRNDNEVYEVVDHIKDHLEDKKVDTSKYDFSTDSIATPKKKVRTVF